MKETYGGKLIINGEIILQQLKIKGQLKGINYDPITNRVELFIKGEKKYFPRVEEGMMACPMMSECTVKDLEGKVELVKVDLVDLATNRRYTHYEKEDSYGKEDYKEEKEDHSTGSK